MCKRAHELSQVQNAFSSMPLMTGQDLEEFYLNTSLARTGDKYSDFVHKFSLLMEDCSEVYLHKLFIGHPGCGKTTELYQLKNKAEKDHYLVCLGRCDVELDSADVEYADVLFYILDLLVTTAANNGIGLNEKLIKSIYSYWENDVEVTKLLSKQEELLIEGGAEGKVGPLISIFAKIKGVIKNSSESRIQIRQSIEPKSSELISRIQEVIDAISEGCNEKQMKNIPLIILDGLDKIPLEQARKIFSENGSRFNELKMHMLFTFPISLTYTPEYADIQTWFPDPEKLPMIKLRKWSNGKYEDDYQEGYQTLTKLVEKRADLSLFEGGVLNNLIKNTGGYIRDLFRCISGAALRARMREADRISQEDADRSLNNLESDINGRYEDSLIVTMEKIYNGEKFVSTSDSMTKLLQIGAVLEYNGERWCDLHPLVEKWLEEHHKIKKYKKRN